jgi:hypothetical protein
MSIAVQTAAEASLNRGFCEHSTALVALVVNVNLARSAANNVDLGFVEALTCAVRLVAATASCCKTESNCPRSAELPWRR